MSSFRVTAAASVRPCVSARRDDTLSLIRCQGVCLVKMRFADEKLAHAGVGAHGGK